ncbi:MAG: glutathione S-transferase N-terminal domain-containing protein [Gammaproteobacteria bacterium]|jgi:RNA polymerase-associated protein
MTSVANRRSVMVLYSDSLSPIGHAVRIVLAEKDINVDINYVSGNNLPEEIAEINPYNTVLTLIDRDLVLYDAQIIMEYLDERFPHPPLMPVDPVARASNRQIRYRVLRDLYSCVDDINSDNDISVANAKKNLRDHLTSISAVFAQKQYFMSDEYTLVDCCMAPLLWRLDSYGIKLPVSAKPLLKYADSLYEREAFKISMSEQELELHPA